MNGTDNTQPQSFVMDFVQLCADTEIPDDFALWSGLAGVSCALGRQVHLNVGTLTFYPNIYVCLVAASGSRKSAAIEVLEPIIYGMEPRPNLIAQKITPEALIGAMRIVETTDAKHLLKEKSQGFVILDELTSLVTRTTYEGLSPLLLQFYNCKNYFTYETKSGGRVALSDTCLGFIAATTPDSLSNAIPESAIGDGVTSRTAFVFVDKESPVVPIPEDTPQKRALRERLQANIQRITMLQGPMSLTDEARRIYVNDYTAFRHDNPLKGHSLLRGYAQRRHSHMFKLSMLLAAGECSMLIEARHVDWALEVLGVMEQSLLRLMLLISASDYGRASNQVLEVIASAGGDVISKKDLVRRVSHRLSARDLDAIIGTLTMGGYIKEEWNGVMGYRLIKLG